MRQATHTLAIDTHGPGLIDITPVVRRWMAGQGVQTGLLTLWCRHTSASLIVQENASPDVRRDLLDFFAAIAPRGPGRYRHDDEGPDDMPAHIRTALTQPGLSIPVLDGQPALGTWQAIYLFEHRDAPHRRQVVLHLMGEPGPTENPASRP
jgi:secondary thiamine-phosphate synthase enzyme